MFDLIIKNGKILSARKEPFFADIGIKGTKIKAIGKIKNTAKIIVIDAKGLLVGQALLICTAIPTLRWWKSYLP